MCPARPASQVQPVRLVAGLLACGGLLWSAACSLVTPAFVKPTVSVAQIEFLCCNLFKKNFLVKLNIQNPNDRVLPVTGLHVELNIAGGRLASGVSNKPFVVPAHGDTDFDVTVTANMALALLKLGQPSDGNSRAIDYDLSGAASIDLPFLHDFPFKQHGSFRMSR